MEEEYIDLKELFLVVIEYFWTIVFATVIGACGMYLASQTVMSKKFNSTTKIYVLNQQDAQMLTYSDLQTGSQLTKDYADLVKSRTVANQVIADLDLSNSYPDMKGITPEQVAGMITVNIQQDTRILQITVTDTDPVRAQAIANAVRVAASTHISKVMNIKSVNVIDYANLPDHPSKPRTIRLVLIGALIGMFLSAGSVILRHILDDTVKTPDDVEKHLGLSVLASIPYDEIVDTHAKKRKKKRKA